MDRIIKSFTIINFGTHEKTVIEFAGPGEVTTLVGESRNGKSWIFRALKKVFYNLPHGKAFIRRGEKECCLIVEYADGYKVSYRATLGGISRYQITYPDGSMSDPFDDGESVPLEVQEITGIKWLTVGDLPPIMINFAEQAEGPFLGNKVVTAPARAKVLGKLAGSEEVDHVLKGLGNDIYHAKAREKGAHEKVNETAEKLKAYEDLPEFEKQIRLFGTALARYRQYVVAREKLKELSFERSRYKALIDSMREGIAETEFIPEAEKAITELTEKVSRKTSLDSLKLDRRTLLLSIVTNTKTIEETARIDDAAWLLECLDGKIKRRDYLIKLKNEREAIVSNLNQAKAVIEETDKIEDAEKLLNGMIEKEDKASKLSALAVGRRFFINGIDIEKDAIAETEFIPVAELSLKELTEKISRKEILNGLSGMRNTYKIGISQWQKAINSHTEKLLDLQEDYIKTLQELGKCPTCGGNINPENLKEVI